MASLIIFGILFKLFLISECKRWNQIRFSHSMKTIKIDYHFMIRVTLFCLHYEGVIGKVFLHVLSIQMANMNFRPFRTHPSFSPTCVIVVHSCNLPTERLTNGQQQTNHRISKPCSPWTWRVHVATPSSKQSSRPDRLLSRISLIKQRQIYKEDLSLKQIPIFLQTGVGSQMEQLTGTIS